MVPTGTHLSTRTIHKYIALGVPPKLHPSTLRIPASARQTVGMPSFLSNAQPLRCYLHQPPDAWNSNKTLQNRYTGADPYYLFAPKPSPSSQTRLSCIRHLFPTPPSGKKPAVCFDNARLVTLPMYYRSRKLQASPDTPQPHVAGSLSSTISLVTNPNHPCHVRARIREPHPSQHGRAQGSRPYWFTHFPPTNTGIPPRSTPRDPVSPLCSWIPVP